jgi:hypothetical protein
MDGSLENMYLQTDDKVFIILKRAPVSAPFFSMILKFLCRVSLLKATVIRNKSCCIFYKRFELN